MGVIRSLDCYRDVGLTFKLWGTMFTDLNWGQVISNVNILGLDIADYIILAVGIAIIFTVSKISAKGSVREMLYDRPALCFTLCGALFICIILFGAYSIGYDATQFIYGENF